MDALYFVISGHMSKSRTQRFVSLGESRVLSSPIMMETGNPDGDVVFYESSETFSNIFPADLGTGSQSLNRRSSNYEMRLSALEEREKAADPDEEWSVTAERAYEKWAKEMEAIEKAEEEGEDDE